MYDSFNDENSEIALEISILTTNTGETIISAMFMYLVR